MVAWPFVKMLTHYSRLNAFLKMQTKVQHAFKRHKFRRARNAGTTATVHSCADLVKLRSNLVLIKHNFRRCRKCSRKMSTSKESALNGKKS